MGWGIKKQGFSSIRLKKSEKFFNIRILKDQHGNILSDLDEVKIIWKQYYLYLQYVEELYIRHVRMADYL